MDGMTKSQLARSTVPMGVCRTDKKQKNCKTDTSVKIVYHEYYLQSLFNG